MTRHTPSSTRIREARLVLKAVRCMLPAFRHFLGSLFLFSEQFWIRFLRLLIVSGLRFARFGDGGVVGLKA